MKANFIKGIESSEILKADIYKDVFLIEKIAEDIQEIEEGKFVKNLLSHSMCIDWADECGELCELVKIAAKRLQESGIEVKITDHYTAVNKNEDSYLKSEVKRLFNLPDWLTKEDIIKAVNDKLF